jgi:hypothetical protein
MAESGEKVLINGRGFSDVAIKRDLRRAGKKKFFASHGVEEVFGGKRFRFGGRWMGLGWRFRTEVD